MESDNNPLLRQIRTKYFNLSKQPKFRFHNSFIAILQKEAYNASDLGKTYCEVKE